MSSLRTFLLLTFTFVGLTGCYDLSAPDGPSPQDFARNRSAQAPTDPAAEGPTEPACTGADCPAESALTARTPAPRPDRGDELVQLNDASQQALLPSR
ncbi:hypothetical protein BH11MYX4_BH11MYX4_67420 [soil metagenome]